MSAADEIRVLVVDDHRLLVDALTRALEDAEGFEVAGTAATVPDALALLADACADVVLLDLRLGGDDAIASIPRFTAIDGGPAVLVLTGSGDHRAAAQALAAGARGYLLKSEPLDALLDGIRTVAGGAMPVSHELLAPVLRLLAAPPQRALTSREREVLRLLDRGLGAKDVAGELGVSLNTARNHIQRILTKLGAHSRLEAVATARAEGLLDAE